MVVVIWFSLLCNFGLVSIVNMFEFIGWLLDGLLGFEKIVIYLLCGVYGVGY